MACRRNSDTLVQKHISLFHKQKLDCSPEWEKKSSKSLLFQNPPSLCHFLDTQNKNNTKERASGYVGPVVETSPAGDSCSVTRVIRVELPGA
jgi:hypothetical protein